MADLKDSNEPVPSKEIDPSVNTPEEEAVSLSPDSQNLLKEFDQAGLEVATMPESTELQERRRKTKNRLRELSGVEGPEDSSEEGAESFEREEGGLMDLLREADLKPRNLAFCCGGLLGVVLLGAMIYGGVQWWNSRSTDEEIEVEEQVQESESDAVVDEIPEAADLRQDFSVLAGVLLGESDAEADEGAQTAEEIGKSASSADELTQLIIDFSRMYSAMEVNVNELLAPSTDRRETLSEYQTQLNYLLYTGKQNQARLLDETESLVEQFNSLQEQKDDQEAAFFDRLRELDAYASSAALNSFVMEGQEIVRLRAHYQAREKLLSYYAQLIENMQKRVEDIRLNEEALVKGITVFDIEGSDIQLIISEDQL